MRPSPRTLTLLGSSAAIFSLLYWISDLIEALQGGFSDGQLLLTLVAEAAIPPIVIGLWLVQRSRMGRLGAISAWAYAYAFVFFTFTVFYALVDGTPDYDALTDDLGLLMTLHGAIMLFAGIGFGVAVVRAGVLPVWTGYALAVGVVLVVATQGRRRASSWSPPRCVISRSVPWALPCLACISSRID